MLRSYILDIANSDGAPMPRDRPDSKTANEIEITPAMIEAGTRALERFSPFFETDAMGVSSIYRAMRQLEESGGAE